MGDRPGSFIFRFAVYVGPEVERVVGGLLRLPEPVRCRNLSGAGLGEPPAGGGRGRRTSRGPAAPVGAGRSTRAHPPRPSSAGCAQGAAGEVYAATSRAGGRLNRRARAPSRLKPFRSSSKSPPFPHPSHPHVLSFWAENAQLAPSPPPSEAQGEGLAAHLSLPTAPLLAALRAGPGRRANRTGRYRPLAWASKWASDNSGPVRRLEAVSRRRRRRHRQSSAVVVAHSRRAGGAEGRAGSAGPPCLGSKGFSSRPGPGASSAQERRREGGGGGDARGGRGGVAPSRWLRIPGPRANTCALRVSSSTHPSSSRRTLSYTSPKLPRAPPALRGGQCDHDSLCSRSLGPTPPP